MSDTPQDDGWWMATDGKWYPPASHPSNWPDAATRPIGVPEAPDVPRTAAPPGAPATPGTIAVAPRPTNASGERTGSEALTSQVNPAFNRWQVGQGYSQLTSALVSVGAVSILATLFGLVMAFQTSASMDKYYKTRPDTPIERQALAQWSADEEYLVVAQVVVAVLWALFAILTIFWLYRGYRTAQSTGAERLKWSPGWAIGGFLIPGANLIVPFLVVSETAKVAASAKIAKETGAPHAIQRWTACAASHWIVLWWLGFATMLGFGFAFRYSLAETVNTLFVDDLAAKNAYQQVYVLAGFAMIGTGVAFGSLSAIANEIRMNFRAAGGYTPQRVVASPPAARATGTRTTTNADEASDLNLTSTADIWRARRRAKGAEP